MKSAAHKATETKAPKTTIVEILRTRYGVNEIEADAITVEWAAEHMAETQGADVAAAAWKRLNAKRERMGRYATIPRYGSPLWNAYTGR
jgi:hypothetical protein